MIITIIKENYLRMIRNCLRKEFYKQYINSLSLIHCKPTATTRELHAKMNTAQECGTITAGQLLDKLSSSENGKRINTNNASSKDNKSTGEESLVKKAPPQLRCQKHQTAKRKNTSYVPGNINLQILGSGANGAPSSVYLFTDNSRYLFNCGEGTQRLAHEHKTKLPRLEQIFLTRNTWSMIGGLPGLALTIQDAGVKELSVHGPPHLNRILQSMKRFVVLKGLQIDTIDCTEIQEIENAVMSVKCLPLRRRGNIYSDEVVVMYVCKLRPRPGALNLEKCVERGVPPGPLLGMLKNGQDVTLENGTVVYSKDVSEPGDKALSFVFLDIPHEDYLGALEEQSERFRELNTNPEEELALVVHFTPLHILENNRYQTIMQAMHTETQHIYLNSKKNPFSGYASAHRIQYQLNQLHPRVFPLLAEAQEIERRKSISYEFKRTKLEDDRETDNESNEENAYVKKNEEINSLTNFHLRPRKGLDRTVESKLNPLEYIKETQILPDFPSELEKLKDLSQEFQRDRSNVYPKITFLGTGSCIPNKTRNVSSILIQPNEGSYMLLDCGEGTLGQIVRFFGNNETEKVIRCLRVIYISHLHADHHMGLIGLLNERRRLGIEEKLFLLAPWQIKPWLDFYHQNIEDISQYYELIGNGELLEKPMELDDVATIATCLVRHCPHSFGVSVIVNPAQDSKDNKPCKITYSGDTMPCDDLVRLGRNSTILIHEATMEDDLIEEAKAKTHSTISQAIEQGVSMEAEHIILTHFSQRYAKLPRMQNISDESELKTMRNVSIAFDNMQVTIDDLKQFHFLYPALKALFAEHAEELEQKALKREQKLERKRKLLNDK